MLKLTLCFLAVFFSVSPQLFAQDSREEAAFYFNRGLYNLNNDNYDRAIEDFSRVIRLDPNNADAYNFRGALYFSRGDYDRAIVDLTQAIRLVPNNADYYYYRGLSYFNRWDFDQAIVDFTHAIRLVPNNADYYYYRGLSYYDTDEEKLAIEDYTRAILLDPNYAAAYSSRGQAHIWIGEYDLAIEDYTQAILLDPNAGDYYHRGCAYDDRGDYDLAIGDFTQAILLAPNFALAYKGRGDAYLEKNDYELAIEDYTRAILLNPNYANAYKGRGDAYYEKNEYDRAIEDYTRAILLDPHFAKAYNNRGLMYFIKGEYDRAIEDYTQTILLDPNSMILYSNRGIVYAYIGEYELAIEDYTQAILLDPNYAPAYNDRGGVYQNKGEYDRAIEDYTKAILLDPNYAVAYNDRGVAYRNKGDYDRAIEDYTQAILLNPNYATAYSSRGAAYSAKGEYDLAIKDNTQAILLNPNNAMAYNNRSAVYFEHGEYDLAIADHEKALETAEAAANINEIFYFAMINADNIYTAYPYLNIPEDKTFRDSYIAPYLDGIARSVKRAEQARSNLGSRGSAIMTQALYFYYMGLDLEANYGSIEKAFEYSESLRSRGFLDQVGTEAALRLPGIGGEERERIRYLLNEIENRRNVLNAFRERPPQTQEEERSFVSVGQTLSVLEAELIALDITISARIPQYAELRNPVPVSLTQAQAWLDDNTAVLIYALWDESIDFRPYTGWHATNFTRPAVNSYCLVLTKAGLTAITLDHDFNYMQAINRLRTNIMRRNRVGSMERDRNNLYNALIKPALAHIPNNIKNLIIVPDGTLGHLPFDILREDYDSPDLGETYRLTLSPSVSVSMLAEGTTPQNLPILAFGGAWYDREKTAAERGTRRSVSYGNEPSQIAWRDLPGTEAEVKMLEQLVASATDIRIFMGSDVSEEQVKRLSDEGELARYPMLHFATHGYFKEDDLERAGIVLSEVSGLLDNEEDGYLTIPEIAVLNLNARMVLLSACETGLGVLKRGDGMVGMVRAFLLAGSEYVGVSLWEIDDEATLEFMTRLYSKVINEGITFREAYYLVKNEFRYHDEWDHPYYWSAFVLYE